MISLDDLKDDLDSSSKRDTPTLEQQNYKKKQTEEVARKAELEDLLNEIENDSEKGFNIKDKYKKRFTSELSDGPVSTK